MPRAPLLLLLLAAAYTARAADVFVIADTAAQSRALARAANETIVQAADLLAADNATLDEPGADHEPVVRKKRTFGDIVFRGLADVLGYNVARKPPQIVFPPPLAPVPGIDAPLQTIVTRQDAPLQAVPFAVLPVLAAPAPAAPALAAAPCGRAAGPVPCQTQAQKPKSPCPKPRANPKPKPQPKSQPPPCASGRANPTTASPCSPAPSAPAAPKADSDLERISSNFRLDFNFKRGPATAASVVTAVSDATETQTADGERKPIVPVAIRPQAARLPPEPPRNPRVYLDAFVVRNGVTQKVQALDALHLDNHDDDNDYLVYDDVEPSQQEQPQHQEQNEPDDEYDYVQESSERSKSMREFGRTIDQFWDQKKNKQRKMPPYDYRSVHFGDRELANQIRDRSDEMHQSLQLMQASTPNVQRQPFTTADDEDEETTTTQDPRRRLKPRILPPTEQNPNQIDTVTVRVPPIYKEKRPKKLHRERPDSTDDSEDRPYEYYYRGPDRGSSVDEHHHESDAVSEDSEPVYQTQQPKRKRRRKSKRKTRSLQSQHYTAGDFDYYGKKIPISKEEEYFRGLTIPPPTKDADLARLELNHDGDGHFLDDHERLRDDPERIKNKRKKVDKKKTGEKVSARESDESEQSRESEKSDESESSQPDAEKSDEEERADETERTDRLGPNARVRESGYQTNFVHAHNVQVDDSQPLVRTIKRKKPKVAKNA